MRDKLGILKMVESGKVSAEEALQLFEALEQTDEIVDIEDEKISDVIRESSSQSTDREICEEQIEEELYSTHTDPTLSKVLDVTLVTCKLNVERANVDDVTIEIRDDKTRALVSQPEWLTIEENEDKIMIKETRNVNLTDIFDFFKGGEASHGTLYLNVRLPLELVIDSGKFSNVSGNVSLIGLNADTINAKSVSGKVQASDLKSKKIELKSVSGNVVADNVRTCNIQVGSTSGKVKFVGQSNLINCKTVSGSIEVVTGSICESIIASSVSGKVSLLISEPEKYNLNLSSMSGSIDTSGFAIVDKSHPTKRTVSISNRSEKNRIEASTLSGKIIIDKI